MNSQPVRLGGAFFLGTAWAQLCGFIGGPISHWSIASWIAMSVGAVAIGIGWGMFCSSFKAQS